MTDASEGARVPLALVGDGGAVLCITGASRPYLSLDAAASTAALPAVAAGVNDFLPWYSSVHRGAGYKSRLSTGEYETARAAALVFTGRATDTSDVAIFCRNTTEAINHLVYRLRLSPDDVVVTTVVEHHANLLPWARVCRRRFVECGPHHPAIPTPSNSHVRRRRSPSRAGRGAPLRCACEGDPGDENTRRGSNSRREQR